MVRSLSRSMGWCILLFLVVLLWYQSRGHDRPSLFHDFGTVKRNSTLHHDFVVANGSCETIGPLQVFVGCASCSNAVLDREFLPPGEEATVKVTLNVGDANGKIVRRFLLGDRRGSGGRQIYAEMAVKAFCEITDESQ